MTNEIHTCPELMDYIQQVGFLPLLTTPEQLLGRNACQCTHTSQESFDLMFNHLKSLLPDATDKQIIKLLK